MDLKKYIKDVKRLKPLATGFEYNPKTWKKLSATHKLLMSDYENKMVTRGDVIKAYKAYYKDEVDYVKPFLLTMIWGFGNTGYGTHRTKIYISNKENRAFIKHSLDAVKEGDIKTAFETLKMIKGLGVSYLSKVLYFATKGAGIKEYSLIYDIRVATALVQLTTPDFIYEIVKIYPSSKFEDYKKYNALLHRLAKKYKLEADCIELFLFNQKF